MVKQKDKPIAPESIKTKRARTKLLRKWEAEKKQLTPQAIAETVAKIHKWIGDNAKDRIQIKQKSTIQLFNQNQDAAAISRKVGDLAEKLREGMNHFGKAFS